MGWKNRPREEPHLGPELSDEHRARLMAAHLQENDARQDAAYARIRERLGTRRVSAGEDWASPAT